jgi:VanZ family protein
MLSLPFLLPRKTRAQVYIPLLVWAAFIFIMSAQPVLPSATSVVWDFAFKKLSHMFVYFVFYHLAYRAISFDVKNPVKASLIAFGLSILYAISDELHQSFVPGRMPSINDVFFDILGMIIAWLSIFKYV